ncbi:MAG: hypothetical protein ABEJ40_02295 [Haloarculaceae archaeon]
MVETSQLFSLLADRDRRRLLLLLCDTEAVEVPGALRTRGEAEAVPARGRAGRPDPGASNFAGDPLAVRLRHVHLPKLAAAGLVEWDRDAGAVSRGPRFGEAEPLLELLAGNAAELPQDLL